MESHLDRAKSIGLDAPPDADPGTRPLRTELLPGIHPMDRTRGASA